MGIGAALAAGAFISAAQLKREDRDVRDPFTGQPIMSVVRHRKPMNEPDRGEEYVRDLTQMETLGKVITYCRKRRYGCEDEIHHAKRSDLKPMHVCAACASRGRPVHIRRPNTWLR